MIGVPARVHVYLACGTTDMRKGFDGLSALVQTVLKLDPHGGALFVFRGKRGDLIKVLWWDGQGLCLFSKRLERGRFSVSRRRHRLYGQGPRDQPARRTSPLELEVRACQIGGMSPSARLSGE